MVWFGVLLALLIGALFIGVLWVFPRYLQIVAEDFLKHLYLAKTEEGKDKITLSELPRSSVGLLPIRWVLRRLLMKGFISISPEGIGLTPEGEELGLHLVRAHRLWEHYLREDTKLPLEEIHKRANDMEHHLTPEQVAQLSARLGHPLRDPHGDPIPNPLGKALLSRGIPLAQWTPGERGEVVHIEDEPVKGLRELFRKIQPGDSIVIRERKREGVKIEIHKKDQPPREAFLNPHEVERVHVASPQAQKEQSDPHPPQGKIVPLSELPLHTPGIIHQLDEKIRGLERHRLLDLGFTPGARVVPVLRSRFLRSGLRAYRIRGTTIALRDNQARSIWVVPIVSPEGGPR